MRVIRWHRRRHFRICYAGPCRATFATHHLSLKLPITATWAIPVTTFALHLYAGMAEITARTLLATSIPVKTTNLCLWAGSIAHIDRLPRASHLSNVRRGTSFPIVSPFSIWVTGGGLAWCLRVRWYRRLLRLTRGFHSRAPTQRKRHWNLRCLHLRLSPLLFGIFVPASQHSLRRGGTPL